jgi:hypothetical protein
MQNNNHSNQWIIIKMKRDMIWFQRKQEWQDYINTFMPNAQQAESSVMVAVTTRHGDVIAKWADGCGQVWEGRSSDRLQSLISH